MSTTTANAPATASATPDRKLRPGQIVRYHGSQRLYEGWLFRVNHRYDMEDGTVRYDLSVWHYGQAFHENDRVWLYNARPVSVTWVPARDILDRKCRNCNHEWWELRGEARECPMECE